MREGIRAAVAHTYVSRTLDGLRVVIQGAGHVGAELARSLEAAIAHATRRLTGPTLAPA